MGCVWLIYVSSYFWCDSILFYFLLSFFLLPCLITFPRSLLHRFLYVFYLFLQLRFFFLQQITLQHLSLLFCSLEIPSFSARTSNELDIFIYSLLFYFHLSITLSLLFFGINYFSKHLQNVRETIVLVVLCFGYICLL